MKKLCLNLLLYFVLALKAKAEYRYVCNHSEPDNDNLFTNFYISTDNVFMSGKTGHGTYKLIDQNENGFFALNLSLIGKDFGIETILIDNMDKTFYYKSSISSKNIKKMIKIKGYCKIYK